jgi:lysophospholipase L1-like esterase
LLFVIALAVSIRLNMSLYQEASGNYRDLNRVRLDPLGLSVYQGEPPPVTNRLPLVVFFGDSRAGEWTPPEGLPGYAFANRSIGAQTTAQVVGRLAQDLAPLEPDIVIVQVGVNDLKTVPLFPEQAPAIIQRTQDNIRDIVRRALDAGAQRVILTTIFPVGEIPLERRLVWSDAVDAAIAEVNAFIKSLAGERVVILETAPLLADASGKVRQEYSRDALHLNGEGYGALNRELAALLEPSAGAVD